MSKDHFVPQAYLRPFIHPFSTQKVLHRYRKNSTRRYSPRGIRTIARIEAFYSQRLPNGSISNELDRAIQELETKLFASGKRTPTTWSKCVYEGHFPHSFSERLELAGCIAHLRARSPVQINNMAVLSYFCRQSHVYNLMLCPDYEEYCVSNDNLSRDEARQRVQDDLRAIWNGDLFLAAEDERQEGLRSLAYAEDYIDILASMRWQILECPKGKFFVTSDNPVVTNVQGFRKPECEIWCPISHRCGFLLTNHHSWPEGRFVNKARVDGLNDLIIRHCYRYVYSPMANEQIYKKTATEQNSPLLGRRNLVDVFGPFNNGRSEVIEIFRAMQDGERTDLLENLLYN